MKAETILALLARKHSDDVFVPECKNGPSYGGHRRLDAWAMMKSWRNPHTYGYEIKVKRSDFLNDNKWQDYLPYCSHFYFAVAPGVCEPAEVPPNCGLMVASKNGTVLYTKRKAASRDVTVPEELFRYVLMARATIGGEYWNGERNVSYWREWLTQAEDDRELGANVSKALAKKYKIDVEKVANENKSLKAKQERYEAIATLCEALKINPHSYINERILGEKLNTAESKFTPETVRLIRSMEKTVEALVAELERNAA